MSEKDRLRMECDLEAEALCGAVVKGIVFSHACEGKADDCLAEVFVDEFNRRALLENTRADALAQLNAAFKAGEKDHQFHESGKTVLTCWMAGKECRVECPLIPNDKKLDVLRSNDPEES